MTGDRTERLKKFVTWVAENITGDEKGQAQIFLDRLFQAFGQGGCLDVGGTPEFRIKKAKEDGGGTAFADYVWKPHVLIEMKKRGENLSKHYRQAFDYWTRLVPGRPRYVVLCNFDQFQIYDFEVQLDTPVDVVAIEDLPQRFGPLAFLFPTNETPIFGNNHEKVTREAADRLALLFNKLTTRGVERDVAQRFVLQALVALFAEDIGLLEQHTLERTLADCATPQAAYDLLGNLFVEMNTPGKTPGGRFKGVDYFNGGVFAQPVRLELYEDEVAQLREAAREDWSKVRPEIFGTIFEHSMGKTERHAYGAHFTSAVDIMKIVRPTISEPWEKLIDSAKSIKRLRELHQRMQRYTVLDPACGSGNFLYLAYREIKRLEQRLLGRFAEVSTRADEKQMGFSFVTTKQFFGLDINPFAVELAKVTMMLAHKLAIDELHIDEPPLPLDNLDDNIVARDALMTLDDDDQAMMTPWPAADVIIGNPPFLGAKRLKPEHGPDYVNAVRKLYPDVPGMADYCVYWFRRAHDHLPQCTADDPVAGRAGLVGTQNIRNNKSREGGLDHIVKTGTIIEAVDNQPWSGEANVHVSIANWVKHPTPSAPGSAGGLLIPDKRKLWFKVDPPPGAKKKRARGQGPATKQYELDFREADHINAALSDQTDVSVAIALTCNIKLQCSFQGVVPGYDGFAVTHQKRRELIRLDACNAEVVRPWLIGRDLLTGDGTPSRSIIDFGSRDLLDAQSFSAPFAIIQQSVLPAVIETARKTMGNMQSAREEHLNRWWQYWNVRSQLRARFVGMGRYLACSRVTKRPIFAFVSTGIVPDGALQVWPLDDDYSFGVIQSNAHWEWFLANCSKLKSDYRYTRRSVWDTFPWPQSPTKKQVDNVAIAAAGVRRARELAMRSTSGGLRAVYRMLELPGKHPLKEAHNQLNAVVADAYNCDPKRSFLEQLLELNHEVALKEKKGQLATGPGVPKSYGDPSLLNTMECIQLD
ncbi:MAG: class I SAM-dependent DNA methyltransferase [Phycisphaerales bacterium]|nr:class I SAM-dependent DNA methyltransferase [Phycisphaerales bacterium]